MLGETLRAASLNVCDIVCFRWTDWIKITPDLPKGKWATDWLVFSGSAVLNRASRILCIGSAFLQQPQLLVGVILHVDIISVVELVPICCEIRRQAYKLRAL